MVTLLNPETARIGIPFGTKEGTNILRRMLKNSSLLPGDVLSNKNSQTPEVVLCVHNRGRDFITAYWEGQEVAVAFYSVSGKEVVNSYRGFSVVRDAEKEDIVGRLNMVGIQGGQR